MKINVTTKMDATDIIKLLKQDLDMYLSIADNSEDDKVRESYQLQASAIKSVLYTIEEETGENVL